VVDIDLFELGVEAAELCIRQTNHPYLKQLWMQETFKNSVAESISFCQQRKGRVVVQQRENEEAAA
jgi:transposase